MPQNDELIRTLVNREGRLVEPEKPPFAQRFPAPPAHVQVPRTMNHKILDKIHGSRNPVEILMGMGMAIPTALVEALLDRYKPNMKAQDVRLPSESGIYDPELLKKQGIY